jgi:hypothetical protein
MNVCSKLAIASASMALGVTPALALGAGQPGKHPGPPSTVTTGPPSTTPPSNRGTAHNPTLPGPEASPSAKTKAYGKYCQGESKQHVAGQPGTPFSKCVTAMAHAAHSTTHNPRLACQGKSKKHVAGQPGTPFSECVSGAAKLRKDQASSSTSPTSP